MSGSIAAFKAAMLASGLVKAGFAVRAVLTPGATRFVTPLTFSALTGHPTAVDVWDEHPGSSRLGHIELARWGDVLAIAPASADLLARLALGLADDMLTSLALAFQGPLLLAPAMETGMYLHPATQQHLETLRVRGATVVGPECGRLASGAEGAGRMSDPESLLLGIEALLGRGRQLAGLNVLVTAGPTYEAIDPVRFVGNRSSGKMGFAIAQEAVRRGAGVTLVSGPTMLQPPPGVEVVTVESSEEMRQAVLVRAAQQDVFVMAAAVADYRPAQRLPGKARRSEGMTLQLVPTSDIAAEAAQAAPHALHVGFALETEDLISSAREKLRRKGQQLVVANVVNEEHNPFGSDTNRVALVTAAGARELPEMRKEELARVLWDEIAGMLGRTAPTQAVQ